MQYFTLEICPWVKTGSQNSLFRQTNTKNLWKTWLTHLFMTEKKLRLRIYIKTAPTQLPTHRKFTPSTSIWVDWKMMALSQLQVIQLSSSLNYLYGVQHQPGARMHKLPFGICRPHPTNFSSTNPSIRPCFWRLIALTTWRFLPWRSTVQATLMLLHLWIFVYVYIRWTTVLYRAVDPPSLVSEGLADEMWGFLLSRFDWLC